MIFFENGAAQAFTEFFGDFEIACNWPVVVGRTLAVLTENGHEGVLIGDFLNFQEVYIGTLITLNAIKKFPFFSKCLKNNKSTPLHNYVKKITINPASYSNYQLNMTILLLIPVL